MIEACRRERRVSALFADSRDGEGGGDLVELYAVLAEEDTASLLLARTRIEADVFESLTPDCPQVHLFEREIAEQYGCVPRGHPWLKPVRFHAPYRRPVSGVETATVPVVGVMDYYRVEGDEVHEVAVGPVHAGIIEPGHFRFQCHGENVFHLEISLGYQHRGIERHLVGGPTPRTVHYMETLAGDTTLGHATAYCHAVEALARIHAPAKAQFIRGIALELGATGEPRRRSRRARGRRRLSAHGLVLRAHPRRLSQHERAAVRQSVRPGPDSRGRRALRHRRSGEGEPSDAAGRRGADTASAVNLLWDSSSVMSRFEDAGSISEEVAREIGLVGPAARASGLGRDVRTDFPKGAYRYSHVPMCTWSTGDVFARAYVRWLEIQNSIRFIREELQELPEGALQVSVPALMPESIVVSLVEGWRGEICHVAITDESGKFRRYKVVDPSFHNWSGLALALRGQEISDFPLCNKSFNLSYAGFDL